MKSNSDACGSKIKRQRRRTFDEDYNVPDVKPDIGRTGAEQSGCFHGGSEAE